MGFVLKISLCKYIYSSVCSTNMSHHIQNWENQGGGSQQGQTREEGTPRALRLGVTLAAPPWVRECRASSRYIERPGSQTKA